MKRVTRPVRRPRSVAVDESGATTADECDLSVLTDTFGFLIRACQLLAFRGFYEALGDTGLTPGSYATLALIGANPGVRQGFVASLLGFREPNMVRLMKELSSAGLVSRKALEHDRRATGLELTPKGRQFMEDIQERIDELERGYTQNLTAKERDTLMALLKKVFRQSTHQNDTFEFHDH
ncbi:MarR family transcriptional regulator [Burkholderia multivorans]|uniref:MarR family winged helix-turn-helix transcriptional regulator n=1 Tax=Burkholderia multivorans TaxID=87883 RepID=UPI001C2435FF|nr:MarR family transcriptional regulator [Burkholderia multivorans]MBU9282581.1 MarR family transcriptional regulator [Burkholderia multivorans]MBU9301016.1 MarR family transcriptional regulator [Burkholderia multivorans]HEM7850536.1 MarR family transcriptional regulator [Burkholderia multivorans]